MILAFAHPGLVVPDLQAACDFYSKMLGFEVLSEEGWTQDADADRAIGSEASMSRGLLLSGHNCHLELWEFDAPVQGDHDPAKLGAHELGFRHIAFYVDDCEKEYERLLALGGQMLGKPTGGVVYCRDPFGNIIELCEMPSQEESPLRLPGVNTLSRYAG